MRSGTINKKCPNPITIMFKVIPSNFDYYAKARNRHRLRHSNRDCSFITIHIYDAIWAAVGC
jgi:hypothetical protein